jgi:hypothetical protein
MADIYIGESAQGAGTGADWANCKLKTAANVQAALDALTAGDTLHCGWGGATGSPLTLTATLDVDTNQGTVTDPIHIIGYDWNNGSPIENQQQATIDADSTAAYCLLANNVDYFDIRNLRLINATDAGLGTAAYCYYWRCVNCDFDDNGGDGWGQGTGGMFAYSMAVLCGASNNGGDGFVLGGGFSGVLCVDSGNGGSCSLVGAGGCGVFCVFEDSYRGQYCRPCSTFIGCVFDGATQEGAETGSRSLLSFLFNRFTHNGNWGIDNATTDMLDLWNVFYNNSPGEVNGSPIRNWLGSDTRISAASDGYRDRANKVFELLLGAEGFRREVTLPGGDTRLWTPSGLPNVPILRRES